jgi:ATP-dependent helicase/nuclease subunit A
VFTRERKLTERERDREFRRLLYVAMTRAADRLYVFGAQNAPRQTGKSWHELISAGVVSGLAQDLRIDPDTGVMRVVTPQTAKPQRDGVQHQPRRAVAGVPRWARTHPPEPVQPKLREKFRPSEYLQSGNDNQRLAPSPLASAPDEMERRLGTVVHALLEFLADAPHDARDDLIVRYLAQAQWNLPADVEQVKAVLDDPRFAEVFGNQARAEVSLSGQLWYDGQPRQLSGQIDRLVVTADSVMIVDYKNGRHVPKTPRGVNKKYIVQMAAYRLALQKIYPGKDVRCALLWTQTAELMELPPAQMDAALAEIKLTATPPEAVSDVVSRNETAQATKPSRSKKTAARTAPKP